MIIRVDENENETVVYRVRYYCWVLVLIAYYLAMVLELTGIPFTYRRLFNKERKNLTQWFLLFQRFWCRMELYPAGTTIRITKSHLSVGYIRWLRGF